MAISWLTVLQSVPWSDVIRNAPKVAESAGKLWNAVGRKAQGGSAQQAASSGKAPASAEARLAALEGTVAELNAQMLASSTLLKELAEQNTQLVQRVEAHRVRTWWLAVATAVLATALTGVVVAWRVAGTSGA